jgi:hypothetical protein
LSLALVLVVLVALVFQRGNLLCGPNLLSSPCARPLWPTPSAPPFPPHRFCRAVAEKGWNGVPYIKSDGTLGFEREGTTYFNDYDDQ